MGYVAVFQQQPRPLARWARALGTDGSAASVATAYARVPAPGAVDQEVSAILKLSKPSPGLSRLRGPGVGTTSTS